MKHCQTNIATNETFSTTQAPAIYFCGLSNNIYINSIFKIMKTYVIDCQHSIYIDSYSQGETENVNNFDTDGKYSAETPTEAIENHFNSLGYSFNKDYIDTDEEEENKIFYSVLCDEENDEATESQIEDWKKDEKILYSNNMIIYVYELTKSKI